MQPHISHACRNNFTVGWIMPTIKIPLNSVAEYSLRSSFEAKKASNSRCTSFLWTPISLSSIDNSSLFAEIEVNCSHFDLERKSRRRNARDSSPAQLTSIATDHESWCYDIRFSGGFFLTKNWSVTLGNYWIEAWLRFMYAIANKSAPVISTGMTIITVIWPRVWSTLGIGKPFACASVMSIWGIIANADRATTMVIESLIMSHNTSVFYLTLDLEHRFNCGLICESIV